MTNILKLLESIMGEICDDYCKYLEEFDAREITEDEMTDICEKNARFAEDMPKRRRKKRHDRSGA